MTIGRRSDGSGAANTVITVGNYDEGAAQSGAGSVTVTVDLSDSYASNALTGRAILNFGTATHDARRPRVIETNAATDSNGHTAITIYDDDPWTTAPVASHMMAIAHTLGDISDADTSGSWGMVAAYHGYGISVDGCISVQDSTNGRAALHLLGPENNLDVKCQASEPCAIKVEDTCAFGCGRLWYDADENPHADGGPTITVEHLWDSNGTAYYIGLAWQYPHDNNAYNASASHQRTNDAGDVFLYGACIRGEDTTGGTNPGFWMNEATPGNTNPRFVDLVDCDIYCDVLSAQPSVYHRAFNCDIVQGVVQLVPNSSYDLWERCRLSTNQSGTTYFMQRNSDRSQADVTFNEPDCQGYDVAHGVQNHSPGGTPAQATIKWTNWAANAIIPTTMQQFKSGYDNYTFTPIAQYASDWFPYAKQGSSYTAGISYIVRNAQSSNVVADITSATPSAHEVLWKQSEPVVPGSTFTETAYGPFDCYVGRYGYLRAYFTRSMERVMKYRDAGGTLRYGEELDLQDNSITTLSQAAAEALTGIAMDFGAKTFTITETRTISELYDYSQSQWLNSTNMWNDDPLASTDGVTFTLGSGWSITVNGGSLSGVDDEISGTVTVTNGGFFRDRTISMWESGGSVYKASRVDYTIKSGGSPVASVELASLDTNDATRLYDTAFSSAASITADSLGVVSGYAVYDIDSVMYPVHTVKARYYGYQTFTTDKTIGGAAIEEDINILTDAFVDQARATVAAYGGISVDYTAKQVSISTDHTHQQVYDYIRYSDSLSANMDEDDTLETTNGVDWTFDTNWDLIVTGAGVKLVGATFTIAYQGTGALTTSSNGFYRDEAFTQWESGGSIYKGSFVTYTVKSGGTPVAAVEVASLDSSNNSKLYDTTLSLATSITADSVGVVSGYAVHDIDSVSYAAHTVRARYYGYQTFEVPKTIDGVAITEDLNILTDDFVTDTRSNVAAYTGISVNYSAKAITVSVDHTHTELHDYLRYSDALTANIDEEDTFSTPNGTDLTLDTDWDLIVTGSGITLQEATHLIAYQGTGALTTASGGLFMDKNLAQWESNSSIYKASPISHTVAEAGTPVSAIYVGYWDGSGNDLTYDTTLSNGALTTDTNGVAAGYAVYNIDTTSYTGHSLYVGKPGYQRSVIPTTVDGSDITTDVAVSADAYYTSSPGSNLTIDFAAKTLTQAGNDSTQGMYDYAMNQWLSNTNLYRDEPILGAGAAFEIGDGYAMTMNSGTVTGNPIQVASGETFTVNGGTLSCGSNIIGTLASASISHLTGTINMQGGTMDLVDIDTTQMTGSFTNGTIDLDDLSSPTSTTLDLRKVSDLGAGLTVKNDSNEDITVRTYSTQTSPTLDVTGPGTGTLTISNKMTVTIANAVDDSYVRLYNVTADAEIDLSTVSGGSGYSYDVTPVTEADAGDVLRIDVAMYGSGGTIKKPLTASGSITIDGLDYSDTQTTWTDMEEIHDKGSAYEGANVTGFSLDVPNIEVDISTTTIDGWKLASWLYYQIATTENGMRNYFNSFRSLNLYNYEVLTSNIDMKVDNTGDPAIWTNAAWSRDDDSTIVATTSATIQFSNGLINVVPVTGEQAADVTFIRGQLEAIETGYDHDDIMRLMASVLCGKVDGSESNSPVFRDITDSKDRVSATTTNDGNRTAVTLDES